MEPCQVLSDSYVFFVAWEALWILSRLSVCFLALVLAESKQNNIMFQTMEIILECQQLNIKLVA